MRLGLFCGSTGSGGANRAALALVAQSLERLAADAIEAGDVADIPIFRPELVDAAPASVIALRAVFASVDGVVFAIPEYGGGAAGGAKNALDWMVGSASLYGRPVAALSAGTTGGSHAIAQIARTLTWQGALVVATLGIASPATKRDAEGRFVDATTVAQADALVGALRGAIAADEGDRRELAAKTVHALGIDPFRRGSTSGRSDVPDGIGFDTDGIR